jgi:TM2 domain-containing membrane protein YozV
MRRSISAALLSGLLFPGVGHLYLKQRRRGWVLITISLAAIFTIVWIATQQALTVVDRISSGQIALDSVSISQLIADSSSEPDNTVANSCLVVLFGCWLAGIVDSFRLGAAQDKLDKPDAEGKTQLPT